MTGDILTTDNIKARDYSIRGDINIASITQTTKTSATQNLCLSPLTINAHMNKKILLAGSWCLNRQTMALLNQRGVEYEAYKTRSLSREDYIKEANLCMDLYDKYISCLSVGLNRLHGTSYSIRYWNTLLHRLLYPLIATIIDKYDILKNIAHTHYNLVADIVDYKYHWINPHTFSSFGASRILHLLIFSIIASKTRIIPVQVIDSKIVQQALETMGDGKKDICSKNIPNSKIKNSLITNFKKRLKILSLLKRMFKGGLPLWTFKYTKSNILALGNQYLLPILLKRLLSKAGGAPYYFYANEWDTGKFNSYDQNLRDDICMPEPDSQLELALQGSIRRLLPTVYLENFDIARKKVSKIVPRKKLVILNSQNCMGRELLDFYIAQSTEENNSHHLMIMHGGGYGVWDIGVQEKVWAQISDTYAMWSNPKVYGPNCASHKMPSLRFHEWQGFCQDNGLGEDILLLITGYYPCRYSYDSTFPRTIDETYEQWQIRFLSTIADENIKSIVIRDYHRYGDISKGELLSWSRDRNIRITSKSSFSEALRNSKLSVSTYTSTTFLTTIVADHPTICYWNPEANLIRSDLQVFFDRLVDVGILHLTPESAARHLNEVAGNPLKWWQSLPVRDALQSFRDNVCYTSPDAIDQWAKFVAGKL